MMTALNEKAQAILSNNTLTIHWALQQRVDASTGPSTDSCLSEIKTVESPEGLV